MRDQAAFFLQRMKQRIHERSARVAVSRIKKRKDELAKLEGKLEDDEEAENTEDTDIDQE